MQSFVRWLVVVIVALASLAPLGLEAVAAPVCEGGVCRPAPAMPSPVPAARCRGCQCGPACRCAAACRVHRRPVLRTMRALAGATLRLARGLRGRCCGGCR